MPRGPRTTPPWAHGELHSSCEIAPHIYMSEKILGGKRFLHPCCMICVVLPQRYTQGRSVHAWSGPELRPRCDSCAMGPHREDRPALSDPEGDDGDAGASPPPPWTVPRVGGQHRHDRDDRTRVDWSRDSGGLHDEREHERTAREDHGQLPEDEVEVADGRVRGERETSARRVTVDSAGTGRGATSRSIMITGAAPF